MVLIFAPSAEMAVEARPTPSGDVKAAAVAMVRERMMNFMLEN